MVFTKPYPPTAITYLEYNAIVDALETRFGPGAVGYAKDRTQIVNSRGNLWAKAPGNIQLAIDDVLADTGGSVWLPKGKITETAQWLIDDIFPIHIRGTGMCWHGQDYGTQISFQLPDDVHAIEINKAGDTCHFGGLYDMTLYQTAGNKDLVNIDALSDWHMERVYMNAPRRHGLHVENTADSWNLWVKDCLIENAVGSAVRLGGGTGSGAVLKSYFLNNYFYANNVDFELGALDATNNLVKLIQFHNNQHFNTVAQGMRLYRKCYAINIQGPIFWKTGGNAVDINDDGAANKCERIVLANFQIDGQATTPIGVNVDGFTAHVVYDVGQIYGTTGAAVNVSGDASDIVPGTAVITA